MKNLNTLVSSYNSFMADYKAHSYAVRCLEKNFFSKHKLGCAIVGAICLLVYILGILVSYTIANEDSIECSSSESDDSDDEIDTL